MPHLQIVVLILGQVKPVSVPLKIRGEKVAIASIVCRGVDLSCVGWVEARSKENLGLVVHSNVESGSTCCRGFEVSRVDVTHVAVLEILGSLKVDRKPVLKVFAGKQALEVVVVGGVVELSSYAVLANIEAIV